MAAPSRWLRRARSSVRLRVALLAAGVFAVVGFAAAALLLRQLERRLVDDVKASAERVLSVQAARIPDEGLPTLTVDDGAGNVRFFVDGMPVVAVLPNGMTLREYRDAVRTGSVTSFEATPGQQQAAIVHAVGDITQRGDVVTTSMTAGGVALATASPLDEVEGTIATATRLLWIVGPALIALVGGLSWLLAGRALRPVRLLTSRVSSIESSSLHERVPIPASSDEIAALARTMNAMLRRLETASDTNRRLVSDASHELRTPIAVMRTELEVARTEVTNDWDGTSSALLHELDRLALLVDDLLLLARGEERSLADEPVDLVDLAHRAAARKRRGDVTVAVDVRGGDAAADGDGTALGRALDHLVANAARSAASRVVVVVEPAAIHVDDDGPGIPAEHRGAVVQRFVRLDEGRGRDAGGAGLGLAVAAEVTSAHGGHLEIADSPLGGARVSILLPQAGARSARMGGHGNPLRDNARPRPSTHNR